MMCRTFTSQKGFSLVKSLLIPIVILAVAILYFLPHIGGDTFSVINQLGDKVKAFVNVFTSKLGLAKDSLVFGIDSLRAKLSRMVLDFSDRWNFNKLSNMIAGMEDEWEGDMETLIDASRSRGFDTDRIERNYDEYKVGSSSWRRVEAKYWEDLREQTQESIEKSFEQFLTRPLGCSDFTVELIMIWQIGESFNEDTFEGYSEAKELSEQLKNPRSVAFLQEFITWIQKAGIYAPGENVSDDWFVKQLAQAVDETNSSFNDYPNIIKQIDAQVGSSSNYLYRVLSDITVGEIYLNHDLINPAVERFDEAIRNLSAIANQYDSRNRYSVTALGLHMALGLLNERMCTNNDLAIKEFKDVIAIGKRLGLKCDEYSAAHYHLAIINLQIKEKATIKPEFEASSSQYALTTKELFQQTPLPSATSEITPTTSTGVIKGTIDEARRRSITQPAPASLPQPSTRAVPGRRVERDTSEKDAQTIVPTQVPTQSPTQAPTAVSTPADYYLPGEIKKGIITSETQRRPERDIRLRPREELGESRKMKRFTVDKLYDLDAIPDDAIREFEQYLKCVNKGEQMTIARFILEKYLKK